MIITSVGSSRIAAPRLSALPDAGLPPITPAAAVELSGSRGLLSVDTGRRPWMGLFRPASSKLRHGKADVIPDQWLKLADHEQPWVQFSGADMTQALRALSQIDAACRLARANASGRVYLVGSTLYRTLIGLLYGREIEAGSDFDFLAESLTWRAHVPPDLMTSKQVHVAGWAYGSPGSYKRVSVNPFQLAEARNYRRFTSGDGLTVDVFSIKAFPSISRTAQGPLYDYLHSVPLALQMLAYDLERGELVGAPGLPLGILKGAMHMNSAVSLASATLRDKVTISQFLARKNHGIDFSINDDLRTFEIMARDLSDIQFAG